MPRDAFGNIIPGSYGPGNIGPGTGNAALRTQMPNIAATIEARQSPNQQAALMQQRAMMQRQVMRPTNASPAAAALLRAAPQASFQRTAAPVAAPVGQPVRPRETGAPTNLSPNATAILRQQQINAYKPRSF